MGRELWEWEWIQQIIIIFCYIDYYCDDISQTGPKHLAKQERQSKIKVLLLPEIKQLHSLPACKNITSGGNNGLV